MGIITRGLTSIRVGNVAGDGGPGTSLAKLGNTYRESPVTMVEADPTIDRLYSHEYDTPLDTEITGGESPFVFSIVDPSIDTLVSVFGGVKTGSGDTATYNMPSRKSIKNQTVEISPRKGLQVTIVNGAFYAKINADFAKAGVVVLDCVVEPQLSTKTGTGPVIWGPDVKTIFTGPIQSLALTAGGSGYTNAGTYVAVALTGGTGSGATATIVVAAGSVTSVTLVSPGTGYKVGDALSAAAANIGTGGTGFITTVTALAL